MAAAVRLGDVQYRWQFLLADTRFPILGIDFLRSIKRVVDVVGAQLLPRADPGGVAPVRAADQSVNGVQSEESDWSTIVNNFPGVSQPFSVGEIPSHGVEHHIVTKGPPVTAKFSRLDPEWLAAAKAEFQQMLQAGVVRRASSSWASPLHMVHRKDGRRRHLEVVLRRLQALAWSSTQTNVCGPSQMWNFWATFQRKASRPCHTE
jgi:hypothetical protein